MSSNLIFIMPLEERELTSAWLGPAHGVNVDGDSMHNTRRCQPAGT